MYVLSQILVVISDLMFIFSMLSKQKKKVVFYLIISTILFGSHYLLLQGWTGAAIAGVEIVFLIVMYVLEIKNKTQYNLLVSIITIITTVILSIITWVSWISVLPMLAMVIYLICMQFSNLFIVKSGTFIRLILNGIYLFLLTSYFGAALTILILIFTIVGIVNDLKLKKLHN